MLEMRLCAQQAKDLPAPATGLLRAEAGAGKRDPPSPSYNLRVESRPSRKAQFRHRRNANCVSSQRGVKRTPRGIKAD